MGKPMTDTKIPKIIHYCWFGGNPLPELAPKCIASWKKFCPDYEIKEWNESNYDVTKINYTKDAFNHKQWAFVSDYARLDMIYEYGGIYLDLDVELIKPLDDLLNLTGFMGFDHLGLCNTGNGFGAIPKLPIIKELRDDYENIACIKEDGSFDQTTCPVFQTEFLLKKGLRKDNSLQEIDGLTIFPIEYFCPKNSHSGEIHLTKNTYSIHHFDGSWTDSALIRTERLKEFSLAAEEEEIYYNALQHKFFIKNQKELFIATNLMDRIFNADKYCEDIRMPKLIKSFLKQIAENGIQNKATSLKLYFTTFRKWKIFETPRANLRYIYHCLRNLLHV